MMPSRCLSVRMNIGIPAWGVVRATNKAVRVIPGWRQGSRSPRLRVWGPILSGDRRVTFRTNLLRQGETFLRVADSLGIGVANCGSEYQRDCKTDMSFVTGYSHRLTVNPNWTPDKLVIIQHTAEMNLTKSASAVMAVKAGSKL